MNCLIRVDASIQIGSGHVMRCLTLATKLRELGARVIFVCRELRGNYIDYIRSLGFDIHVLPTPDDEDKPLSWNSHAAWLGVPWEIDADETVSVLEKLDPVDWLIVDHYALDEPWEKKLHSAATRIMVFDDLVESRHDSDLLLNQNFYSDLTEHYRYLVPSSCRILQGIDYALLRPEFAEARKSVVPRSGIVREILVFLGGSDQYNVTQKVLNAVVALERPEIRVNVVVGQASPYRLQIQDFCLEQEQMQCLVQTNRMAELMASADLSIGAGGATSWERYCLGLPTLLVTMAYNQEEGARFQADRGLVRLLGDGARITEGDILMGLKDALESPDDLAEMSRRTMAVVDGQGCERVVNEMMEMARHR